MGEITDLGYKLSFSGDQTDQMLDLVNDRTPTPASGSDLPFTAGGAYNLGLAADVNYYIDPNGSDSNDGLSASTPFATIQKAVNMIPSNLNGRTATINLAAGTYSEYVDVSGKYNGALSITGASATIAGGKFTHCDRLHINVAKVSALTSNERLMRFDHIRQAEIYVAEISDDSGAKTKTGIFANVDANVQIVQPDSATYPVAFKGLDACIVAKKGSIVSENQRLTGTLNNNYFASCESSILFLVYTPTADMATTLYSAANGGRIYAGSQASVPSY